MLTNRQIKNIKNFDKLKSNHRRVFRYVLKRKLEKTLNHLNLILLNYQNLHLRPTDIINLEELNELVDNFNKVMKKEYYKKIKAL